jgi:hypothetical protein
LDERYEEAGGGLVNLDFYARAPGLTKIPGIERIQRPASNAQRRDSELGVES